MTRLSFGARWKAKAGVRSPNSSMMRSSTGHHRSATISWNTTYRFARSIPDGSPIRLPVVRRDPNLVVVTAGGGADGESLLRLALGTARLREDRRFIIVAGPYADHLPRSVDRSGRISVVRSVPSCADVFATAGFVVHYWSTRLLSASGLHLANDLRDEVFSHLQRQSLRYHGERQVGDLAARVTGDVERSQDTIVQTLSVLFPNLLLINGTW